MESIYTATKGKIIIHDHNNHLYGTE